MASKRQRPLVCGGSASTARGGPFGGRSGFGGKDLRDAGVEQGGLELGRVRAQRVDLLSELWVQGVESGAGLVGFDRLPDRRLPPELLLGAGGQLLEQASPLEPLVSLQHHDEHASLSLLRLDLPVAVLRLDLELQLAVQQDPPPVCERHALQQDLAADKLGAGVACDGYEHADVPLAAILGFFPRVWLHNALKPLRCR